MPRSAKQSGMMTWSTPMWIGILSSVIAVVVVVGGLGLVSLPTIDDTLLYAGVLVPLALSIMMGIIAEKSAGEVSWMGVGQNALVFSVVYLVLLYIVTPAGTDTSSPGYALWYGMNWLWTIVMVYAFSAIGNKVGSTASCCMV